MSIKYNYEVVKVDMQAKCMEIVYTSQGRQTMHVGTRLPYKGETLEAVVDMYSPVAYWLEQEAEVIEVIPGTSGTIDPTGTTTPTVA